MLPPGTRGKVDERKSRYLLPSCRFHSYHMLMHSRLLDIAMKSLLNSLERDIAGWLALFHQAEPRLRFLNVVKPPGSALSVMELELAAAEGPILQLDGLKLGT